MARQRRMSISRYKTAVQHTDSLIANIGHATVPTVLDVLRTDVGARTLTGASQTIQDAASSGRIVRTGDIVKYVNLFIQITPRFEIGLPEEAQGWLEWAFLMVKESETQIPITNLGVQTLGEVATNMYRNECIYTGFVPATRQLSSGLTIAIKVPKFKQKIRIGDEWRLVVFWRSSKSTDVNTANVRIVLSTLFKAYS